jgi:hypothetical protein
MPDLREHAIANILKYKPVKYLIIALLGLVVLSGIYHFYRCGKGLNSRFLWGAQECMECKTVANSNVKHDTIVQVLRDTVRVPVTVYKEKQAIKKENAKKADIEQQNTNGDNQANVNSGTNNGVIGNDNNIFIKPKSHPTEQLLNQIENALPNKDQRINIMAITSGAGSGDFATELNEMMKKRGYAKTSVGVETRAPLPPKGVTLDTSRHQITLHIYVD